MCMELVWVYRGKKMVVGWIRCEHEHGTQLGVEYGIFCFAGPVFCLFNPIFWIARDVADRSLQKKRVECVLGANSRYYLRLLFVFFFWNLYKNILLKGLEKKNSKLYKIDH